MNPPAGVQRDFPLARLTTIRTGGHGRLLRAPGLRRGGWPSCSPGPTREGIEVGVVGSGSNLLVADAGFRGLVMKLDGSLATIEQDGERLLCGGGARLPQAAAFAARAGLSGLEFGVNIPGTVGGAVKMNANAYGGDLARVLEWVEVRHRGGHASAARPGELGFQLPPLEPRSPREIVARAVVRARRRAEPDAVKATLADMRALAARRPALRHQDLRLHLQEPRRPARGGPQRRACCSTRPAAAA